MSFLNSSRTIRSHLVSTSHLLSLIPPGCLRSRGLTTMSNSKRSYGDAIRLLNSLQSNNSIRLAIANADSAASFNDVAIPEMVEWVRRAGYDVGRDFDGLKIIHIAGTKGKGSVSAMTASILGQYRGQQITTDSIISKADKTLPSTQENGASIGKVGLYTSPHLLSVQERICIDGQPISEQLFTKYFFEIWERLSDAAASEGHLAPESPETKPLYFRYLTIMALHVFLQEGVETAILECGIGGEYDSTNILPANVTSTCAITRLGIDHVGMLGNTLEKIAWNKAGIMREEVECYTVPQPAEAMSVLRDRASEKHVSLQVIQRHPDFINGTVQLGLQGDFQKDNASLAVAVAAAHLRGLKVTSIPTHAQLMETPLPNPFKRALEDARWSGRCEARAEGNIEWCIDGGHTIDSMEITGDWFASKVQEKLPSKTVLIFNQAAQERDAAGLLKTLHTTISRNAENASAFSNIFLCTNNARQQLTTPDLTLQESMAAACKSIDGKAETLVFGSIEEAINHARELAKTESHMKVLVTGSLYLVGGFLEVLDKTTKIN